MNPINSETNNNVLVFKLITDFISNIHSCYATKETAITKPIKLYTRLVTKTSIDRDDIIQRHIDCFTAFCKANHEQILEKSTDLVEKRIIFSERIYVDMEYVFSQSKEDGNTDTLFEYLLAIHAYVSPSDKALELLQTMKAPSNVAKGLDLLKSMNADATGMKQIQDAVQELAKSVNIDDITENPMAMIGKLMQSEDFNNVVNRVTAMVQNNDIDIASLMGTATAMAKNSGIDLSALADMADLAGMGGDGMPDLSKLLQPPPE